MSTFSAMSWQEKALMVGCGCLFGLPFVAFIWRVI